MGATISRKDRKDSNWSEGAVIINGMVVTYQVKHYEEPSVDYGIDGGKISKLWMKKGEKTTLNYDRGWDIEPEDEETQLAYWIILKEFN